MINYVEGKMKEAKQIQEEIQNRIGNFKKVRMRKWQKDGEKRERKREERGKEHARITALKKNMQLGQGSFKDQFPLYLHSSSVNVCFFCDGDCVSCEHERPWTSIQHLAESSHRLAVINFSLGVDHIKDVISLKANFQIQ